MDSDSQWPLTIRNSRDGLTGLFSNQERAIEQGRKKTKDKCENRCPKPQFVH